MKRVMSSEPKLAVIWRCDKKDCLKPNYRTLEKGSTITTDNCDSCQRHIREPIWEEVGIKDGDTK